MPLIKKRYYIMNGFVQFFVNLRDGRWGFGQIIEYFKSLNATVEANAHIAGILEKAYGFLESIAGFVPYVFLAVYLIECFFGKKLLGVHKFIACFIIGYGCGVTFLAPLLDKVVTIPAWVTGIVIAIVAAVFCKIIHVLALIVASGYGVYILAYSGTALTFVTQFTAGSWIISAIAGVVAVVLVLSFRKFAEIVGTAFAGAYFTVSAICDLTGFLTWSWVSETSGLIIFWIATGLIALLGFIVQWSTRRRY